MPPAPRHAPDSSESESSGLMLAPGVTVSAATVRWAFSRSAGPGGQNVNKLSTKAELRIAIDDLPIAGRAKARLRTLAGRRVIDVETYTDEEGRVRERGGELILTSESERSQSGNKAECLEKLREMLVQAMAEPKVRRKTKPSRASKERRIEGKKRRGEIKRGRKGGPAD